MNEAAPLDARRARQDALSERDYRFALTQYRLIAERVGELQAEREAWIRNSIIGTFAFFGWIGVYRDTVTMTFMLGSVHIQALFFIPLLFNAGGGLRFYFIQRDINRHVGYLADMERDILCLPERICNAPSGRGIRDRHWHMPSIAYWLVIIALSAASAAVLGYGIGL